MSNIEKLRRLILKPFSIDCHIAMNREERVKVMAKQFRRAKDSIQIVAGDEDIGEILDALEEAGIIEFPCSQGE